MIPSDQREEWIIRQARERPMAERAAFLDGACAGDLALRERLGRLLSAHDQPEEVLADGIDAATVEATIKLDFTDEPADDAVGRNIGRYKVLEKVGEGGCGVVYVAEQTEPVRRRVALKVIKLGMDTKQVVARFEAERQALAMMDHPNIAKVLDGGSTESSRPFFVMELVRGIRITEYCDQHHLSTKERLELFIPVCQAIQHAHQKGIIHRDIKPSNILVTMHDGLPVPKVIDFGIAKATEGRLTDATVYTQLHQFIGTPAYMSPEQAEMSGLDVDTRSDIYSLGVLLYELLTGLTPFDADELMSQGIDAMRKTIREQEPVRPSTKVATLQPEELTTTAARRAAEPPKLISLLRGDLDWIVMKCLEKDRTRRYDTANGLGFDIKRHLNNEPVLARPPSTAYRFQKALGRNKLAFAAAASVLTALAIGLAATSWQAIRATRAKQEQNKLRQIAEQALKGEKVQRAQAESERQRAEFNAKKATLAAVESRRNQYAADMFAATAAIEKGSYGSARSFLHEYFPKPGMEELRGFEWRYWWQMSAGQQLKTFSTGAEVNGMAWSPDGRLIAGANSDGTLKLLRAESGEVALILTNGAAENFSVSFSNDGNGLATVGEGGSVHFWNVRDGRLLFALPRRYEEPRVACSPTGPLMAIGTGGDWWGQKGGDVFLVETTSGKEVRVLPRAGDRAVFSPDGKTLATANWGEIPADPLIQESEVRRSVILWDVDSGERRNVLPAEPGVLSMAFSPDGLSLAVGTKNGEVSLWNLKDSRQEILREKTGIFATSLAFSRDGRQLAVGMLTHEVEIWDVQKGRRMDSLRGHTHEITSVAYSPDGAHLASGSRDGSIRLWDSHLAVATELVSRLELLSDVFVGHPTFSPDSRWLAAASTNGDVHILDLATAECSVRTVLTNAGSPVAFSSDAAILLTLGTNQQTLHRFQVGTGALLSTTRLSSTNTQWDYSATAMEGKLLVLAADKLVELHETATGLCLNRFTNQGSVSCLELSPDGRFLGIGSSRNAVVWDIAANRAVRELRGHQTKLVSIRFSPDQRLIATTSWDETVRLWDASTGEELAKLTGHMAGVLNSAFSPDGRTLVTGSGDRTMKFWNVLTRREIGSIASTDNKSFFFVAFSPDGTTLAANHGEGALRCWRAPSLAEIDAAEAKVKAESKQP